MRMLILFAAVALVSCEVADTPRDSALQPQAQPAALECAHDCDHLYRSWVHSERRRHRMMVRNCGQDATCLVFEAAQHDRILTLLDEQHAECLADCDHQQGAGEGGQ